MERIVAALTEQHRELDGALASLSVADWARPSRCPGWTVADVVLHLAQTDEMAAASGQGRLAEVAPGWLTATGTVDDSADEAVRRDRGAAGAAVYERWRAAAAAVRTMFAAADPSRKMRWVVGELPARTLATTRLAEAWLHTGDVVEPLGIAQPATDRLWHIARLAWRTLPYAFARDPLRPTAPGAAGRPGPAGPVGLDLVAPDGSTWSFGMNAAPVTVVRGPALDLCLVAGRRLDASASRLVAEGADAGAVLRLVRTFA